MSNAWCKALGIETPSLDAVVRHPDANTYALLLVALLERGGPMTLEDVASRFEQAGVADRARALLSLKRCQPARPPVYRVGDLYHLDPTDDELGLWTFRLGLEPPRFEPPAPPPPMPIPGPDVALTREELSEAWENAGLGPWSAQRLVLAVLDATGGPAEPAEVADFVARCTPWKRLRLDNPHFQRRNSAVRVLADGRWAIADDVEDAVRSMRIAVRELLVSARTRPRFDPVASAEWAARVDRERAERGAVLAARSRALLVAFPPESPRAAALVDVGAHEVWTFVGDEELADLRARLERYEVLGAIEIRALLHALGFDPGGRQLAELGPPQKSVTVDRRTLKLTTAMLVQGSCGIAQPFGDPAKLAAYLRAGELTKLRRRLASDVKSLHALDAYARLHGLVRLRWGFLDELLPAPWVRSDEPKLHDLMRSALGKRLPLEVVTGSAPGWEEPWARARLVHVAQDGSRYRIWLEDEHGGRVDEEEIQRARLPVAVH